MSEFDELPSEEVAYEGAVRPYMFEPMAETLSDVGNKEDDTDVSVVGGPSSWCRCNNCAMMDTAAECVCCQNIEVIKTKCEEVTTMGLGRAPGCITQHPGFSSVCLDVWVLQAVYNEYKQRYGNIDKPLFDQYRYCAYRHLVRWCWGYIGKHHRVVLPACAVAAIRQRFPAEDSAYCGFRLPAVDVE